MFRFSFGGLLVLFAVLYFSGAGPWLWEKLHTADQQCINISQDIGGTAGGAICQIMGDAVRALDNAVAQGGWRAQQWLANFKSHLPGMLGTLDYSSFGSHLVGSLSNGSTLGSWASPSQRLSQLTAPELPAGSGIRERVQASLDNFIVGQRMMQTSSLSDAMPWLQQGAAQPGYGVLSQLSLGSIYQQGGDGVARDPATAAAYYQAALDSIRSLAQSDTPEADQMLRNLPASPQVMQQQLTVKIAQLRVQAGIR